MTHTSVISAVPCTAAATVAGTMKIADAIIVPALIMIASNSPNSRLRSVAVLAGGGDEFMSSQIKRWKVGRLEGWKVLPSNLPTFPQASVRNQVKDKIQE